MGERVGRPSKPCPGPGGLVWVVVGGVGGAGEADLAREGEFGQRVGVVGEVGGGVEVLEDRGPWVAGDV